MLHEQVDTVYETEGLEFQYIKIKRDLSWCFQIDIDKKRYLPIEIIIQY